MKKIKDVSYPEVVAFFQAKHPTDLSSPHFSGNMWGLKHLEWANDVAKGEWSLCELDSKDILGIVFSQHSAEETGEDLVDEKGMTVADAAEKLGSTETQYAKNNPICWAKIMYWQEKDFSPLFLSTQPTPGKGRRSLVDPSLGTLFHQDGLHRLLRWSLDGRFEEPAYSQGPKLTAFISGRVQEKFQHRPEHQQKPLNIFEEVKKLELPLGHYIVLGSGILGALGIRDIGDVDLLVSPQIFEKLKADGWKYEQVEIEGRVREKLSRDFVEIYKDFWYGGNSQFSLDMIAEAEIIDDVPFLSLLTLREIKKVMNREKDKKDVLLIDEYLS